VRDAGRFACSLRQENRARDRTACAIAGTHPILTSIGDRLSNWQSPQPEATYFDEPRCNYADPDSLCLLTDTILIPDNIIALEPGYQQIQIAISVQIHQADVVRRLIA